MFSLYDLVINSFASKSKRLPWRFSSRKYKEIYPDVALTPLSARKHYRYIGKKKNRLYQDIEVIKKDQFDPNKKTVVLCCDQRSDVIINFNEFINRFDDYNIVLISNSKIDNQTVIERCNEVILSKNFDRSMMNSRKMVAHLKRLPNIEFIYMNILDAGFFCRKLKEAGFATVLELNDANAFEPITLKTALKNATHIFYQTKRLFDKICVENMEGYPDQVTIYSAGARLLPLTQSSFNQLDEQLVLGCGNVSFEDGFDIFYAVANHYKNKYPDSKLKFKWIDTARENQSRTYGQYMQWLDVEHNIISNPIIVSFDDKNLEQICRPCSIVFDTSRFSNNLSLLRTGLMAGKVSIALRDIEPYCDILKKHNLSKELSFDPLDYDKITDYLHTHLETEGNKEQKLQAIAHDINDIHDYADKIVCLGNEAFQQLKQEKLDALELLHTREFDYAYWTGKKHKKITLQQCANYIRSWKSGMNPRRPCAGFHPGIYAEHNDLGSPRIDPFLHYIKSGKPDGPWAWNNLIQTVDISDQALKQKIALHIHAYYVEQLDDMIQALLFNKVRPDLYITVRDEQAKAVALSLLADYPSKVEVLISPNKGRDIGPLLTLLRPYLMNKYDIIGHIHTKYSAHVDDRFRLSRWRKFLNYNLLGDGETLNAADSIIETLYHDKDVNLIFPDDRHTIGWVKNRPYAEKLAQRLGIEPLPHFVNFPSGTMFWATHKLMQPFFALDLQWDDYPDEPLAIDGTMLHAIERLFGAVNQTISAKQVSTLFRKF